MHTRAPALIAVLVGAVAAGCGAARDVANGTERTSCTRCHDSAGSGAHAAHVDALGQGACAECHPDPRAGSTTHMDGQADFAFGALATHDATLASTFDRSDRSCSAVYCHGAFTGGNGANEPVWAQDGAGCGTCHAFPPTTGAHGRHVQALGNGACAECHPDPLAGPTAHVDGQVDVAFGAFATHDATLASTFVRSDGSCRAVYCHGAFAGGNEGNAPVWAGGQGGAECGTCHGVPPPAGGAHAVHVAKLGEGACAQCHADPRGGSTVHMDGRVELSFGALATRDGALAPTFDWFDRSCSAVYCHGAFPAGNTGNAPTWTDEAAGCGTCHDVPPPATDGGAHAAHMLALGDGACFECHADPRGGSTVHVDGRVDVAFGARATHDATLATTFDRSDRSCSAVYCHGTFAGGNAANAPVWAPDEGAAACGTCHPVPPAAASGAHAKHLGTLGDRACAECHPDPLGGSAAHVDGLLDVAFGDLATHDATLASTFDRSDRTCSAVYCHGAFAGGNPGNAPTWAAGQGGAECGTCHPLAPASGAHPPHVAALGGGACAECHAAAIGGSPEHVDGRADVAFGAFATHDATLASTFVRSDGSCRAVYCHGAFTGGNTGNAPAWAMGRGDADCGTCHGLPPGATHAGMASTPGGCARCHPSTIDGTGSLVAGGAHMDGEVGHEDSWVVASTAGPHAAIARQGLSTCRSCHGADLGGGRAAGCAACHASSPGALACASCHPPIPPEGSRSFHARTGDPAGVCRTCHDPAGSDDAHPPPAAGGGTDEACIACHTGQGETLAGRTPSPLVGWSNPVSGDWHGARAGTGWGGTLKPPYVRGQGPLPCQACHDRHSSGNAFLIAATVNGAAIPPGAISRAGVGAEVLCAACHAGARHASCYGCHRNLDPIVNGRPCFWCHGHEPVVRYEAPYTPDPGCCDCHYASPPAVDAIPPVITGPTIRSITSSGATIAWTTNEAATSWVEYGVSTARHAFGDGLVIDPSHVVTLTGLAPSTTYVWRVRTADQFRNVTWSELRTFTTLPPP